MFRREPLTLRETQRHSKNLKFKKKVENSIPCGYIGIPEDVSPVVFNVMFKGRKVYHGSRYKNRWWNELVKGK